MITMEELIELCKEGDPIIDPEEPDSYRVIDGVLHIDGQYGPGKYAAALRITKGVAEGSWTLSYQHDRDGEWFGPVECEDFDSLHGWVYTL